MSAAGHVDPLASVVPESYEIRPLDEEQHGVTFTFLIGCDPSPDAWGVELASDFAVLCEMRRRAYVERRAAGGGVQ